MAVTPCRHAGAMWTTLAVPVRGGHLLLPDRCGACRRPGPSPCAACAHSAKRAIPLAAPPGLDRLLAPFAYEGVPKALVQALKFRGERAGVPWLTRAMATAVAWQQLTSLDMVTWAPTTPRRRRRRGHDHAEVLARAVATHLGLPCGPLLVRRPGRPQTGRDRRARLGGPVFAVSRGAVPPSILLIDDVSTTGATLTAAAAALRSAGAGAVAGAVACRTASKVV